MTFVPACLPGRLWVSNAHLEMVIAAFPAMIYARKELQDHIFASLTHIIAHFDLFSSTLQIYNVTLFLLVHSQRRLHVVFFIGRPKRPTRSGSLKTRKVMSDQRKGARAMSSL